MKRWCILNSKILFILTFFVAFSFFVSAVSASSIYFSQCANGASPSTDCSVGWVAGMLQSSNSHYHEDEVVPQRIVLSGPLGTGSVTISYDTKNGGVHAYDSLATWNYTVKAADPCQGFSDVCSEEQSIFAIPDDPTNVSPSGTGQGIPVVTNVTSAHMIPAGSGRVIFMYGGIITNVSVPTHTNPLGDVDAATVTITYNVTNPSGQVMILFGGHLAPSVLVRGWGSGLGASSINGNFQIKLGSGGSRTNQVATGTILPIPGNITIRKVTDPISDPTSTSFGFTINGGIYSSKPFSLNSGNSTIYNVESGVYTFTESNPSSIFAFKSIECSNDQGSNVIVNNDTRSVSIKLGSAGNVNCTFTNKLLLPNLVIIKHAINDNGGTKVAGDFSITVSGTNVQPSATFPGSESGTAVTLDAGAYSVSETELNGYTASYSADCSGSVNYGDSKTCTITNDDQPGTLIVKKVIVNDNGGAKTAQDFSFSVNGGDAIAFESDGQNDLTVNSGNYTITEPPAAGYDTTYDNCENVYVPNGGSATCTITNDYQPAKITLIKNVINDNGGTARINDFGMTVDSTGLNSGDTVEVTSNEPHTINEAGLLGYNFVSITGTNCPSVLGGNVTLGGGEEITCTITNDDIQPKLTITKVVVNDNGGTKQVNDFPLFVDSNQVNSGQEYSFNAGAHTVSETSDSIYNETITGDCASDGTITLNVGDVKSCTITNDDMPGTLTVIKHVINDDNGTAVASDFTITLTGTNMNPVSFSGDESGTNVAVNAGSYAVDESGPSGYNATFSSDCYGVISIGETKTCTITNDDIQNYSQEPEAFGKLTVIKHVSGGNSSAQDFTMFVTGINVSNPSFAGNENGTTISLDAGSYIVDEAGPNGYVPFISSTCFGNISSGQTKTCTIINNYQGGNISTTPTLEVIKHVINDDGGIAIASNFTITVTGATVTDFPGNETGTILTLDAGIYSVDESGPSGYGPSFSSTCSGTISDGQFKTCTIINDDKSGSISNSPILFVIKHVINDNGGNNVASNFTMNVNGTDSSILSFSGSESGTAITLDAGNYNISEDELSGYAASLSSNCVGSISDGQLKTCTIINDDVQPYLTIIKQVTNDNGGSLGVNDFSLFIDGTSVTSGVINAVYAGTHIVSETQQSGYTLTGIGGDCNSDGTIVLSPGDNKTCTITNDDIAPQNQPVGGGSSGSTIVQRNQTNQTSHAQIQNNACVENWSCSNWSTCQNGVQTRTCTDVNNCGTSLSKPNETQSCPVEQGVTTPTAPTGFFLGLMPLDWLLGVISAIIAGVAGAIFLIIRRRKK